MRGRPAARRPESAAALRRRLAETERTLHALLAGQVDAVLDSTSASALLLREAQEDLRRLNERLERSEAYFRALIENVTDLIALVEGDGTIRYLSPAVRRILGHEPDALRGRRLFDLVHPDDAAAARRLVREALAGGRTAGLVAYRCRHHDGSWRQLESTGINLLDNPTVGAIVITSRDITERVEIEGRYQALFENMVLGVAHCRLIRESGRPSDFVYIEVNRAFETLTGLRDVVGRRLSEVVPDLPSTNPEILDIYERVATTGVPERFEAFVPALDRWFAVSVYSPSPEHFVAVFDNVTERKRTEERLRHSEAEYRGLVERSPLGVYRSTPDGRLLAANPALVAMLGYDSVDEVLRLRMGTDVYADRGERERLRTQAAEGEESTAETQWKRRDGSLITVRLHVRTVHDPRGAVAYYEGLVEDITEQRRLEQQFMQAQKMEAVGRLAGGVAHDFNNLLTAIAGYTDLLLDELAPGDPKREDLKEIRAAAHRATGLTRQLLAFSRRQVLQTRALDTNYVVRAVEGMLKRLIGEDITLKITLSPTPTIVKADAGQLEQVILNLAVNARDAMPDGGCLAIETAHVELDEAAARLRGGGMTPGRYALLVVSDTGVGMDADTLSHIFEPFFTTKGPGKGTGLGLATVYGIVKQSGGWIWVDSAPGRGTTFEIYLPSIDAPVEAADAEGDLRPVAGGRETVLLVEDDAAVRDVASRVLSQRGYTVLPAPHGGAALETARIYGKSIDLLLTDLIMPGMTGRELAAVLESERPGLRVIFMSGYTDDAVVRYGVLEAELAYLQKPFTAEALARKVREVLDAG
ncbi:MAG TPA: PAS domain S-box protein [Vicinamibacterales bacterium]|nr:PAS domain S-box protein [Vicinamibacterales bacterium]